ncbi:hypothetical protein [Marinilabilia sp.]|uniref:hypothetical protein n=1 Tax=Marinilabilia sp. TaxID=2021252 RepID=UPI0025C2498E|nr:hypothetical protein [Marinilabilia sp.]
MSRKSYLEQACEAVPEFKKVSTPFLRKYTISGKPSITLIFPIIKSFEFSANS